MNEYLKEFPQINRMLESKLGDSEIMDVLEYGILGAHQRKFTMQGFNPKGKGLKKS